MFKSKITNAIALVGAAVVGGVVVLALQTGRGHRMDGTPTEAKAMSGASDDASSKSKQLWTCGMHPQVIQDHPGTCPICHMKLTPLKDDSDESTSGAAGGKRKILYYWDPMLGPSSIAHAPGKSAMNMDLVPVFEDEQSGGPVVKIDPTIVQNMGVRTAEVTRGPLELTVRTVGMLEVPEPAVYEVNLKVNGWIEKLYANTEGMHIHKGEPLFDLYSPDLQVAEEELIGAVKALDNLDPMSSESVRRESQSMVDSAKQKFRLWGIADEDIDAIKKATKAPQSIAFRSSADGDLVEKMVVEGSAVQAGMKLMRIEDHTKLWLNAQVYEDQIPSVTLGQMVEAVVDGVPGKTFTGPIMFIYPHVDHMTRTVTVRVELANPKHELRPGMYATANIVTKPVADAVLVPREAVIDTGTRQIAFVVQSEGHFDPRKVRMGVAGDGDRVEIVEGLAPGEKVVTSGQFLMDVESRTTEAIDKLRNASSAGSEMPTAPDTGMGAMGTTTMSADKAGSATSISSTMMGSTMMASTMMSSAATQPDVSSHLLAVAHCPMKNADWLQRGDVIANPYFGTAMPTCGALNKSIAAPPDGSPLDAAVKDYLVVAQGLDADKLDTAAIQTFKTDTEKLPDDKYAHLKMSAEVLVESPSLEGARRSFQSVSAELIHVLESPAH